MAKKGTKRKYLSTQRQRHAETRLKPLNVYGLRGFKNLVLWGDPCEAANLDFEIPRILTLSGFTPVSACHHVWVNVNVVGYTRAPARKR